MYTLRIRVFYCQKKKKRSPVTVLVYSVLFTTYCIRIFWDIQCYGVFLSLQQFFNVRSVASHPSFFSQPFSSMMLVSFHHHLVSGAARVSTCKRSVPASTTPFTVDPNLTSRLALLISLLYFLCWPVLSMITFAKYRMVDKEITDHMLCCK